MLNMNMLKSCDIFLEQVVKTNAWIYQASSYYLHKCFLFDQLPVDMTYTSLSSVQSHIKLVYLYVCVRLSQQPLLEQGSWCRFLH